MVVGTEGFPGPNRGSRGGKSGSTFDGVGSFGQERPSRSSNSILVSLKVLSRAHSTFYVDSSVEENDTRKKTYTFDLRNAWATSSENGSQTHWSSFLVTGFGEDSGWPDMSTERYRWTEWGGA